MGALYKGRGVAGKAKAYCQYIKHSTAATFSGSFVASMVQSHINKSDAKERVYLPVEEHASPQHQDKSKALVKTAVRDHIKEGGFIQT